MTQAIRTITTVDADGNVRLPALPQAVGKKVEVIILLDETILEAPNTVDPKFPLRGMPYKFDDPFSPVVSPEDWEPNL